MPYCYQYKKVSQSIKTEVIFAKNKLLEKLKYAGIITGETHALGVSDTTAFEDRSTDRVIIIIR
jgi:hypothetical protein